MKRIGNFGIVETSAGLVSHEIRGSFSGVNSYSMGYPDSWDERKMVIGKHSIVPLGQSNDMPDVLRDMLDENYSGEGILSKIQGLQWGEGPRVYREVFTDNGEIVRQWVNDVDVNAWLRSWNWEEEMLRCHTDLTHGFGFFYKVFQTRGGRIGKPAISHIVHVPVNKARIGYPREGKDDYEYIVVGSWPHPQVDSLQSYPRFDRFNPFKHPVSMGYQNLYSFAKSFYSTPRFYGAYSWMRLASSIAPLLTSYNINASAIKYHIESPGEYWEKAEDSLKERCRIKGEEYKPEMLEKFKQDAFEEFTAALTGQQNVGKFLHTVKEFDHMANSYEGWKVTALDNKIKDFIEAQIKIADKADSASTSGFGLHPSLSNIVVDGKMNSGSEMLYALKAYIASETAIPEMILFAPFNAVLEANFPDKDLKFGFYRKIMMKEDQVSPGDRLVNQI